MKDKSWLLNPAAIAAAKNCIHAIESELAIKLKLSHPQFEEMIKEYCELTDSSQIIDSYQELKRFSQGLDSIASSDQKIVSLKKTRFVESVAEEPQNQEERVAFKGKSYLRFDDQGLEFKGLYRGQARYS